MEKEDKKIEMPEYHQSGVGMFLKCQKQYFFRHIMGMKIPPASYLAVGKSIDNGSELNFAQKIETKKDLPLNDVLDACSTTFDKESTVTEWEPDETASKVKDQTISLMKLHHTRVAPKIQPATVKDKFRIETDAGYSVAGEMDLTTDKGEIRDTKTSKQKYSEDAVSTSIQAAVYDFAYETKYGKKPSAFVFDVLKKTKVPDYQEVPGQVSENQREMTFEAINIMHSTIKKGDFLPAPEGAWWCSKDWCGYWSLCKGKKT